MTCKGGKAKRGKVKVVCTVRLAPAARAKRVPVRLTRRGIPYATGASSRPTAAANVRLRALRAIPAVGYRLTSVSVDRRGRTTVRCSTVVVLG